MARGGGPERQTYSDPDGFYGHRIHAAVCAVTGLPLAWQVETARNHESRYVAPLLDMVSARGFRPETVAMDKGYDNTRIYAECEQRDCAAIIPLRKGQPERPLPSRATLTSGGLSTAAAAPSSANSAA